MKKIYIIFLILTLILSLFLHSCALSENGYIGLRLSLFLNSCNLRKDGYVEVWSHSEEFDDVGFDFDQYIEDLQNDDTIQIEEIASLGDREFTQSHRVTFADQSVLTLLVCPDVETAKNEYQKFASSFIGLQSTAPLLVCIRLDNVVVVPKTDLLSNERLISFAKSIGIKSEQIALNKINNHFRNGRKSTRRSFEDILKGMEEKGFTLIDLLSFERENDQACCFVSADNSVVYELYMVHGDNARAHLFSRIKSIIMDSPYREHIHVYYSIGDDFCMYFAGSSADTRDFWDEIRK